MPIKKNVDKRLAVLEKRIAVEHEKFKVAIGEAIHAFLADINLTPDDLVLPVAPAKKRAVAKKATAKTATPKATKKRKAPFKGKQPPKYRDPETGATWSGLARPPSWIAGEKNRARFLIQ
ncbi:H-NS family nucleoid-associated regulatory protein [Paraburkholderia sp. MM6662-R1]|uniref:H-NS family nucleoid-associated regulatory protein n=1 Tax=Paraburkholderia sp. MM6662-R1 TaxID=2991066 RepID=UPI003D253B72